MLIDTHAHLDMPDFRDDLAGVIRRALDAGVGQIVTVGIDADSSRAALGLAREYDLIFATVGCHPHNADSLTREDMVVLEELAGDEKCVAWGEIGLDYYRNRSGRKAQIEAFERQLAVAAALDLPVVIHDRDAHEDILSCIRGMGTAAPRGIIHCFSGDLPLAEEFLAMGFYISVPGTVTFPKAETIREVAARLTLDRLLVETDAPYLTPVPYRGKRNEPARVVHTAREIARLRDADFEEVARVTTRNARDVFGLPEAPETERAEGPIP